MERFRKTGSRPAIASEARSLEWLAAASGAPVVPLLGESDTWLETQYLASSRATPAAAEEFGRCLALTHAAGADFFGQGPPGLDPADSLLADLPHPLLPAPVSPDGEGPGLTSPSPSPEKTGGDERDPCTPSSAETAPPPGLAWGEFYATLRVEPYVRIAVDGGNLGGSALRAVTQVMDRLARSDFDTPLPRLCRAAGRLHGDLWGGNVLWTASHPEHPGELAGVLIDPAAHGGHPETDLAELALFGSPHLDRTLAAYHEVSPLADGWTRRVNLHQLHMLAVHAAKFGGSYGAALGRAAEACQ